jgi:isopenicillin N synthase-like dioxygenase
MVASAFVRQTLEERASMTSFSDPPRLPTIDLSLFDVGDPWRDHVAAQVDWASSTFGLFHIVGHGVDAGLIDTLLELSRKFIAQQESARRAPAEGRAHGAGLRADLPGFRDAVHEYTTAMTGLGHKLMTTMARGLHLADSYFVDRYTGKPATLLRILDYPITLPPAVGQGDTGGDLADREFLTIVKHGETGQQVQFRGGWIEVPDVPGALLCYVGPVFERLTTGHYLSAVHRLSSRCAHDRLSVSFSFEPDLGAVLAPIAEIVRAPAHAEDLEWRGERAESALTSRLCASR